MHDPRQRRKAGRRRLAVLTGALIIVLAVLLALRSDRARSLLGEANGSAMRVPAAAPAPAMLAGRVFAADTRAPIANAMVCAREAGPQPASSAQPASRQPPVCVATLDDGAYLIRFVAPGLYEVTASAPGYDAATFVDEHGVAAAIALAPREVRIGVDVACPSER